MMEQEIIDYIAQAQNHGLADFEIKQNLLNVGWEAAVVEENFVFAKAAESKILSASPKNQGTRVNFEEPSPIGHSSTVKRPELATSPVVMGNPQTSGALVSSPQFQTPASSGGKPFYKKPLVWIILLLALIGAGVYGYYNYVYATPAMVWQKFLTAQKNPTNSSTYSISYTDNGFGYTASTTQSLNVTLQDNAASDFSDVQNPKMSNDITLALGSNGLSYSLKFKYLLLGQVVYFDVSQIDLLKNLMGGQNLGWLKVDLNELQQYANQTIGSSTTPTQINAQLKAKLSDIWSKANVITPTNFLAKEKINNTAVYHLKNQFNNEAFGAAFLDSINAVESSQATGTEQLTDQQKQALTAFFSKFQAKEFDVYIGQNDYQLYKIHLNLNAPTIKDLSSPGLSDLLAPLSIAKAKSRDAKRLADVRQMASALELYFNDHNGYPEGLNGSAQGLSPTYLGVAPSAPEPADGNCTDYYNSYWYQPQGKAKTVKGVKIYPSFALTFCLGQDTGGYGAGIGQLTPQGIAGNIACPTTPDKCVQTSQAPPEDFTGIINQMSFSAQITFDASYSDFGKPQDITAPANSTDIFDLIKNQIGSLGTSTPLNINTQ